MNLDPRREAVLAEARSWDGTPYHHQGRIKGAGVDCLTLIVEVYQAAGIIGPIELPFYPPDAVLHRGDERYFEGVLEHGVEVEAPRPGDIALYRYGACYGHGAIVIAWPYICHADAHRGRVMWRADGTQGRLAMRRRKFIDPFPRV